MTAVLTKLEFKCSERESVICKSSTRKYWMIQKLLKRTENILFRNYSLYNCVIFIEMHKKKCDIFLLLIYCLASYFFHRKLTPKQEHALALVDTEFIVSYLYLNRII